MVVGVVWTILDDELLRVLLFDLNNLGHYDFQWSFSLQKAHSSIPTTILFLYFPLWKGTVKIDGRMLKVPYLIKVRLEFDFFY